MRRRLHIFFLLLLIVSIVVPVNAQSSYQYEDYKLNVQPDRYLAIGHTALNAKLVLFNSTSQVQSYSGTLFVGGPWRDGDDPYVQDSLRVEVSENDCSGLMCQFRWSVTLQPGEIGSLTVSVFSNTQSGHLLVAMSTVHVDGCFGDIFLEGYADAQPVVSRIYLPLAIN